jgi:hypothetical protein
MVKIGDLPAQKVLANFDTGGIFGCIPAYLVAGTPYVGELPPGITVPVYSADGATLHYSYKTTENNTPAILGNYRVDWFVTGYVPLQRGPIYIDLQGSNGKGATNFVYT